MVGRSYFIIYLQTGRRFYGCSKGGVVAEDSRAQTELHLCENDVGYVVASHSRAEHVLARRLSHYALRRCS